jgi:glycosyltransferase involved in cell wall biosynthesis
MTKEEETVAKPRVLMLAFACEPDEGSEPEVGWKWANVMAESCDITVVTQAKNRERIEQWCRTHPEADAVGFSYLELGPVWRWLKKRMPGGMYVYYTAWQWRLRKHVAGLLRERTYDLLHHVTFASFRMPVWVGGLPVVWGPVGGAETAPMHLLKGYGTLLGRTRERFRNLNTWLAGKLVRWWEPSLRSGGISLASTPATAALLIRNGIPCVSMPTIGYDGEIDFVNRDFAAQTRHAPLRLLYVGRLHLLKGVHLLLEAMARLERDTVHLTLVGDGAERLRLESLASRLGIAGLVSFRGFVPRRELGEVFGSHDVLAAPSLYESGGLSVLEGFAHGLPAIVLDCGGHALSVDDSCGRKIPTSGSYEETVSALAGAIREYVSDPRMTLKQGAAARRRLLEEYAWPVKKERMLMAYRRTLGQEGRVQQPS